MAPVILPPSPAVSTKEMFTQLSDLQRKIKQQRREEFVRVLTALFAIALHRCRSPSSIVRDVDLRLCTRVIE